MFVCVKTVSFLGPKVLPVRAEVSLSQGRPSFTIVGLGDKAVNESRERVYAALDALGHTLPPQRITVNLSPADLSKVGTHFDLPICLGLLAVMGVISPKLLEPYLFMGELSLNGALCSVNGVLPASLFAQKKNLTLLCAKRDASLISWATPEVKGADNLPQVIRFLNGSEELSVTTKPPERPKALTPRITEIYGQYMAKKALVIAAAGRHNLMMVGTPGSGKTLLAKSLLGLLPPLSIQEALATEVNYSLTLTKRSENKSLLARPFRTPHHTTSGVALVGGGLNIQPGEVALAHNGILFLDELAEFSGKALDALREPLENQAVSISRANYTATFMADFQLIAAMNPCKCGYAGQPKGCGKEPSCVQKYAARLSGPFLDRFDLYVNVKPVPLDDIKSFKCVPSEDPSPAIRQATKTQQERNPNGVMNARLSHSELEKHGLFSQTALQSLQQSLSQKGFSTRAYHRMMRVARTIADLEGSKSVEKPHMLLALQFRQEPLGAKQT